MRKNIHSKHEEDKHEWIYFCSLKAKVFSSWKIRGERQKSLLLIEN